MKKLELVISPNPRKKIEFKQTLDCLADTLKIYCTDLTIDKAKESDTYTLTAIWENTKQMRKALQSEDFAILSGAISALCDKTLIRHDGKPAGNDISMISSLIKGKQL